MSASEVFSLVDGRKTPPALVAQCQDHLGHKYRRGMHNQMQVAQVSDLSRTLFEAYLRRNDDLIKNSVLFKSLNFPID